eukprot:592511-Pyramimonas_sp.AAC.1
MPSPVTPLAAAGIGDSGGPPPLARLASAPGICPLLSRDWLRHPVYALSSHAIGRRRQTEAVEGFVRRHIFSP